MQISNKYTSILVYYVLITIIGYEIFSVKSQNIVSPQIRHGLIPNRLQILYGSDINANCTDIIGEHTACNGTSVLNDGIIPILSGVSNDSESKWAAQLFTLRRPYMSIIIVSFELEDMSHDRVELAVFNCLEMGISAPEVEVYFDSSFRPGRSDDRGVGVSNKNASLENTSCDQLLTFCVRYNSGSSRFINLVFPFPSTNVNSTFVFLGEVTFLNGNGAPCREDSPTTKFKTDSGIYTETQQVCVTSTCANTALIASMSALVSALLVAGISVAIHIAVYQCLFKPRLRSATVVQGGTEQRDDVSGGGDAIVYDVIDELRVESKLEMKENIAYGTAKEK